MKLHLPISKHHKKIRKDRRINPHTLWLGVVMGFVLIVTLELIASSILFLHIGDAIDAPATPSVVTNASKLHTMDTTLTAIESAIGNRTGGSVQPSQKQAPVIQ